jgi:hypothetical protein
MSREQWLKSLKPGSFVLVTGLGYQGQSSVCRRVDRITADSILVYSYFFSPHTGESFATNQECLYQAKPLRLEKPTKNQIAARREQEWRCKVAEKMSEIVYNRGRCWDTLTIVECRRILRALERIQACLDAERGRDE